ncbi:transcriptional regulator PpsR [Piscinibacter sakaiensis]|uniref:Regulator of carotenoid biosynthesis n=1 Tax=Piscinibacter sakaiensis TaxID=1547922 RepID=A0A0K8NVH4_PISS1|nr:transcriptional regulator PpsR [Piscinibacter sakaiensis]GAP34392.1 regulator of carotenoid biosynthesis [Piscinibacter sakaiensis]
MDTAGEPSLNLAAQRLLRGVDPALGAALLAAAVDVVLVLDAQGVVEDVVGGPNASPIDGSDGWIGRHWLETVTVESRPKVLAMLRDAMLRQPPEVAWRQLNHPAAHGADIPVQYCALPAGERVIAVGRDLRGVALLQQRLVDAQQAMERDYLRLRQSEARYRLLFESVDEAVLVLDAATQEVLEANQAALQLFGDEARRLVGRPLPDAVDAAHRAELGVRLAAARGAGRLDGAEVALPGSSDPVHVSGTLFKGEAGALLLLRLVPPRRVAGAAGALGETALRRVVEGLPDAFVVTDLQGRVLVTNRAFADLVQLPAGEQAQGQSLDRWLGRSAVDLNVLMGSLRQQGVVRLFPTTLRDAFGGSAQVEISAVAVPQGEPPCLGFAIRDVERRLSVDSARPRELARSPGQLAELVGRVPLKDIVDETTCLIERMCIETALQLTRDNRASAAEMLGLSRQSLYVKLRRYGLGDLGGGEPSEPANGS